TVLGADVSHGEGGDPGWDYSVLSEFRDCLVERDAGRQVLDAIPVAARENDLLVTIGKARTDSTHVQPAARDLNWLTHIAEPDWFRHYATRADRDGRDAAARGRDLAPPTAAAAPRCATASARPAPNAGNSPCGSTTSTMPSSRP
ncbi:hypothetical protein ACQKH3_38320, partial [Streptomyces niveus]